MKQTRKCLICDGTGQLPKSIYKDGIITFVMEICGNCNGKGYIEV